MHIATLITNTDTSAFAKRHDDDGAKFRALLAPHRPDWTFTDFDLTQGVFPKDLAAFDGVIITGSPASVHDPDGWIMRLLDLIRDAHARRIPIFGTCFGHQAVALALGGQVTANPNGWVFGRVETALRRPNEAKTAAIDLYAAHMEQVTKLPPNAVQTGSTTDCPNASFAVGQTVWTTQYHPEMTHDFMTALIEEYQSALPPEAATRAKISMATKADRQTIGAQIVAFFEAAQDGQSG